jgi:hypothetical protein
MPIEYRQSFTKTLVKRDEVVERPPYTDRSFGQAAELDQTERGGIHELNDFLNWHAIA